MITISIIGLDPYVTAHYSKDHTANLANLFEVKEEEIVFEASNNFIVHNGVEQTSWNSLVRIYCPHKYEPLEKVISKYLGNTLKDFSIHLAIEFHYFHDHSQYKFINNDYQRFLNEDNLNVDVTYEDEILNGDEDEGYNENIYDGNIFEGFEEKLDEVYEDLEKKSRN